MTDDEALRPEDEAIDEELDTEEGGETDGETSEDAEKPSLQEKIKEALDVAVEEIGSLRRKLVVTVPRAFIDEQLEEQYGELSREAAVPGFRKGRAPRRLLEKRFGSEIGETLVQQLVGTGLLAAIEKADLKVLGDPMLWATEKGATTPTLLDFQEAMKLMEIPKEGDLVFSCEVEIRPEFELPELEKIPLTKPVIEVTDEMVTAQIDNFRRSRGSLENLADDGQVAPDDLITGNLKMTSEGTIIKEQEDLQLAARGQVIDGVTLENLGEALTGARAGEVRTISGQIPDTYVKEELRGKQADFEITIRRIQRMVLPEMNEEYVKSLGFEDETELRDYVRQDIESRIGDQVRQGLAQQVREYLLEKVALDLPERLSGRQVARVMYRRMVELYQQGVSEDEVSKHIDALKTAAQNEAVRELKLGFIMEKLNEQFEVDVTEGEVNGQIAWIAQRQGLRFDRVRDRLAKEGGLDNLYLAIRDGKLINLLVEKAEITGKGPDDKTTDQSDEPSATAAGDTLADET